jgi:serine/threonine-protein kinase RsbW
MIRAAPMPLPGDQPAMRTRFTLSFAATDLETRANIGVVARRLQLAGLTPDRTAEIEVALTEAVNNVVEHAYAEYGTGSIRLLCSLRPGHLDIRICDTGRPLPAERLPPGLAADLSVAREHLPEGGFGWFLIRAFTTEIRYDRCGNCNHLSLRFDI